MYMARISITVHKGTKDTRHSRNVYWWRTNNSI